MTTDGDRVKLTVHTSIDQNALMRVLGEVHRRGARIEALTMVATAGGKKIDADVRCPAGRAQNLLRQLTSLTCVIGTSFVDCSSTRADPLPTEASRRDGPGVLRPPRDREDERPPSHTADRDDQ